MVKDSYVYVSGFYVLEYVDLYGEHLIMKCPKCKQFNMIQNEDGDFTCQCGHILYASKPSVNHVVKKAKRSYAKTSPENPISVKDIPVQIIVGNTRITIEALK